ncbi:MFS transporter [Natronospirillum operosum]|nr:MFS transporter [Natronospirillum operosum]
MTLNVRFFLTVFLPFALGYYLSYFYRVVNGVIAEPMVLELGLTPGTLGWIGSAYFLFFAAAQLPLGVLLDRYDTRNVAAGILLIAVLGAVLFAVAETPFLLWLGRGLVGLGVSACLMAAFRAYVATLQRHQLPLVNGLQLAAGGLGAMTATVPVEWLLPVTGWRGLFLGLAVLTLAVALLVRLRVPPILQRSDNPTPLAEQIRSSLRVFVDPRFLRVAPASVMNQAILIAWLGLWAAVWMREVDGLSAAHTADLLLITALGMTVGYMTLGALATWLQQFGISTTRVAITTAALFSVLMLALVFQWPLPRTLLWLALGYTGSAGSLMYAGLTQQFPHELAGRVNTALNLAMFVTIFLLQWLLGVVIGLWPAQPDGSYPILAYQVSFGLCAAAQILALLWFWWRTPRPEQAQSAAD